MEVSSWENHLFLWAMASMAMLNNQRVEDIKKWEIVIRLQDLYITSPTNGDYILWQSNVACWKIRI
jgi:hypothetical protein